MDWGPDRRRFLELAGVSAMFPLAGCNSRQDNGKRAAEELGDVAPETTTSLQPDQQTTTAGQDASTDTATVTLAVQHDEEALQRRQTELLKKLKNGTIDRSEFQQRITSYRTTLTVDAVERFRERVRDDPAITVHDAAPRLGALLVSGTPASLIETLSDELVGGLFPKAAFQKAENRARTSGRE